MTRPLSIVRFEQCYLAAVVVGLVNSALNWSSNMDTPQVRQATAMFGSGLFLGMIVFGIAIDLLLWYFVARRGSVVAKWFVVVFFAFSVFGLLSALAHGTFGVGLSGILTIVGFVLNAVAVWMLFRPDTRPWFDSETPQPLA